MSKLKKATIAYFLALVSLVFLELYLMLKFGPTVLPSKHSYILTPSLFLIVFIFNLITLGIFYLIGVIGIKKNKHFLEALSFGVIFWIYIVIIPGILVMMLRLGFFDGKMGIAYLFSLVQIIIGGYLIFRFKLPKATIILAFLLPGLASLYYLIYGIYKTDNELIGNK